jgi:phasin family protein
MAVDSRKTGDSRKTAKKPADPPFAEAMGQAQNAAEQFTRVIGEMKFPALPDAEALLGTYRRNMEALSSANRIALEGAQSVAKRHMEIMQQQMAELTDAMRALAGTDAPQAKAAKQAEMLKRAYERAVSHARELSELIQRSNRDALEQLNTRFVEAMDEVKRLVDRGGKA